MDKIFTVAGVSVLNGKTKVRFANDLAIRIKVLARNGHTAINLVELPTGMDKVTAAKFLSAHDSFADVESQATINQFLGKRDDVAPVAHVAKKAAKAKVAVAA